MMLRRPVCWYVEILFLILQNTNLVQGRMTRSSCCFHHRHSHPSPTIISSNTRISGTGRCGGSLCHCNTVLRRTVRGDDIHIPKQGSTGIIYHLRSCSSATTSFSHSHRYMTAEPDPFQILISDATGSTPPPTSPMIMTDNNSIGMLSKEATIIIFIIGLIPFLIATYEFWRRIAVGATFGTGNDSVVFPTIATIGEDNAPSSSRGKQILGADSLITAYIIFTTVAVVLGIVLYAVVTSPIPPSV